MCTSVSATTNFGRFFSRNLDLDYGFGDGIIKVPRLFELRLRCGEVIKNHAAFLGIGGMADGYPLLADGMNEWGLCIAGLRYRDSGAYPTFFSGRYLAPFEVIPYILATCRTARDVRQKMTERTILDVRFNKDTENQPMHFHVSASDGDIVLEMSEGGLEIYENNVGVLTNSPAFPYQLSHLSLFLNLDVGYPKNDESARLIGTGVLAHGLPGDYSSLSRFVRAWWHRRIFLEWGEREEELFDLMCRVAPPRGAVLTSDGIPHYTRYTAIMDTKKLRYTVKANGECRTALLSEVIRPSSELLVTKLLI